MNYSIVEEYFLLTKENKEKHGDKTVVFLMVGAFYEIYAIKISEQKFNGSDIEDISKICDLSISNKQSNYKNFPVYMCGFRDYTLDKYVLKMTEQGYTCVIYDQFLEENKKIKRVLAQTFSPGSIFSSKNDNLSNNTVCIWFHEHKNNLLVGISCVDIITGKVILYEYTTENTELPSAYDDLERFLSIYKPSEMIIISSNLKLKNNHNNYIKNIYTDYLKLIEYYLNDDLCSEKEKILNCEKQVYIKEIISSTYKNINFDIFRKLFLQNTISTQSFVFLINFIYERNPSLIKNIKIPEIENCEDKLILANHSLKQLNVMSNKNGKYSNLYNFLNNCKTIMGQRKLKDILFYPSCNVQELKNKYDLIEYCLSIDFETNIREQLNNFKDFDKYYRQIVLKRIIPKNIYDMYQNLISTEKIIDYIKKDNHLENNFICPDIYNLKNFLEEKFQIEKCLEEGEINIFRRNVYKEIDDFEDIIFNNEKELKKIIYEINKEMKNLEKKKKDIEYVKMHQTEKSGLFLVMTKKRAELLLSVNNNKYKIKKMLQNNQYSIENDNIKHICNLYFEKKNEFKNVIQKYYLKTIEELETYSKDFYNVSNFISEVDVLQNKCYVAKKYNYSKPIISENKKKSFINVKDLRHPLVEHIQQDELYVSNDIFLGEKKQDGVCLFGTNAVGKTCFIKSIGLNIIMAQSGFYVSSSKFEYYPYQKLFTRILNNDNMFKGLSTFAVEMCELRNIITMANNNSLILGDELCSGTENVSAVSIFIAGLKYLSQKESSFIFATHFHEIVDMDDVSLLKNVKMKHLSVLFEPKSKKLMYDRKIKNGSGESIYGLEVCKSLFLPEEFIKDAYEIRKTYLRKRDHLESNKSVYNSNKILSEKCEICKNNKSQEIHHLQYQKFANENNYIKNIFHKNHSANLVSICEKCHNLIHSKNIQYIKKKTTTGEIQIVNI